MPVVSIERVSGGMCLHCSASDFAAIRDHLYFHASLGDVEWMETGSHFEGKVAFQALGIDGARVRSLQKAIQDWVRSQAGGAVDPDLAPPYMHLRW